MTLLWRNDTHLYIYGRSRLFVDESLYRINEQKLLLVKYTVKDKFEFTS